MIPILFSEETTDFSTHGLGDLTDAVSCIVTEERNGVFELEMEYPADGIHFSDITYSRIILAQANQEQDPQAFRIYSISKPIGGVVTINADHISYQLSWIPSAPTTSTLTSASAALAYLKSAAYEDCPFTFSTDITDSGSYSCDLPRSIRASLGGEEGSVLSVFGGEYEFDNWTVTLHEARGTDSGVTLRYGKNITDINQEENIENTYTGVCPYWLGGEDTLVQIDGGVIHADTASNYPFNRTKILDLSSSFESQPSQSDLEDAAEAYMTANDIGYPSISISISFVNLADTEEYADIAPLENVGLCDYVHVYFEKLDIEATAKVVKTVYNTLLDRYDELELGDAKSTFATTIISTIQASEEKTDSTISQAVLTATNLITGNTGGYVRFVYDDDNFLTEILIMDTQSIDTATKVWRWNASGLGYSSNGYEGDYNLAMTIDGAIVADFITTGTLSCNRLSGGTISGQTISGGTISGTTISGTTISGATVSGTTISGGTITGTTISGSTFTCTSDDQSYVGQFSAGTLYLSNQDTSVYSYDFTSITGGTLNTYRLYAEMIYATQSLTVNGNASVTGSLTVGGNLTISGYIESTTMYTPQLQKPKMTYPYISEMDAASSSTANLRVSQTSYGYIRYIASSSEAYKEDIEDITDSEIDPTLLYDLPVRQFHYIDGYLTKGDIREGKLIPGFIAEEVAEIYPIAADYKDDNPEKVETWAERYMIPPMLKLIQDQKAEIDALKKRVEALEKGE